MEAVKQALTGKGLTRIYSDFAEFKWVLQHVAPSLHNDAHFILNALEAINDSEDRRADIVMRFAAEDLRADRRFIADTLSYTPRAVLYASDALRCDQEFLLAAIAQNSKVFDHVPFELRIDGEFRIRARR